MRERRYKIIRLPLRTLVTTFNVWLSPDYFLCLPVTDTIPEDSIVVAVQSNFSAQCIEAVIYHESFSVVRECEAIPVGGLLEELKAVPVEEVLAARGFTVSPINPSVVTVDMEDFDGMDYDKMAGYLADDAMGQLSKTNPDLYARLGGDV